MNLGGGVIGVIGLQKRLCPTVYNGILRIASLIYAYDVVLLATADHDLLCTSEQFPAEFEVAGLALPTLRPHCTGSICKNLFFLSVFQTKMLFCCLPPRKTFSLELLQNTLHTGWLT